jgi:PAS domain-containing protein
MSLFEIALELNIALALWLCLGVSQADRSTPGRATFGALCLAAMVWCTGELVCQRHLADEWLGDRIKYLGVLALPPLWAGFAAHAARLEMARRAPWFPIGLLLPHAMLFGVLFAGGWSSLYTTTIEGAADLHGPLWWVSMVYSYLLVAAGSGALIASALREHPLERRRQLAVGFAALVPLVGNVLYAQTGLELPFPPTPVLFCVSLLALRQTLFSGGLLQTLPVSHAELVMQIPVPLLLTDRRGTVVQLNPAAERRLGIVEEQALNRSLDAVLTEAADPVEWEITPVRCRSREVGQIVLLDAGAKRREPPEPGA